MLVQLGTCQFVVKEEERRTQVVGGGTIKTMSIHGVLPSQEEGADIDNSIDNLRAMMNEGRPQLLLSLVSGTCHNHDYWVIEEVRDDLLTEEFKIKLRWYGERLH